MAGSSTAPDDVTPTTAGPGLAALGAGEAIVGLVLHPAQPATQREVQRFCQLQAQVAVQAALLRTRVFRPVPRGLQWLCNGAVVRCVDIDRHVDGQVRRALAGTLARPHRPQQQLVGAAEGVETAGGVQVDAIAAHARSVEVDVIEARADAGGPVHPAHRNRNALVQVRFGAVHRQARLPALVEAVLRFGEGFVNGAFLAVPVLDERGGTLDVQRTAIGIARQAEQPVAVGVTGLMTQAEGERGVLAQVGIDHAVGHRRLR
ncbi:hypothetical protein G6F50_014076 [Rhizopus delemar]|uniref:Uncharacterized protein n=1 Tax=Rhizopus delemar TaxID=936053 RepID=A0A9P7C9G3_9FUNG|nr:hypothetical protein G6F50_014076 [Rhizopus delemar]